MDILLSLVPDGLDEDGEPVFETLDTAIAQAALTACQRCVDREMEKAVKKAIGNGIHVRVDAAVEKAMTKPFQLTDSYGNPRGEATTFAEQIMEEARQWFTAKVNAYGEIRYDGKSRVAQAAMKTCEKELDALVTEQKQELRVLCQNGLAKLMAEKFTADKS